MEEQSNNQDVHGLKHQEGSDPCIGSNFASDMNDRSETINKNIPTKGNDFSLNTENKISETHGDSRDDNLSSKVQEIVHSGSNMVKKVPITDEAQLSIESELEKMHGGVNDTVNETIHSFIENDDKMDWTEDLGEASSANIELTKEQMGTESVVMLQKVLEDKSDTQSDDCLDTSGDKEKLDVIKPIESNVEPEIVGATLEQPNEAESASNMDTSSETIDESDIAVNVSDESLEKVKGAAMESEIVSIDSDTASLDKQSVESRSISIDAQSLIIEPQPLIVVRASDLENIPIPADTQSVSSLDHISVGSPEPITSVADFCKPDCVDSQSNTSVDQDKSADPQPVTSVADEPICVDSQSISSLDCEPVNPQPVTSEADEPIRVDSPSISSLDHVSADPQPVASVADEPIRVDSPSISSLDHVSADPQPVASVADEPIRVDSPSISSLDHVSVDPQPSTSVPDEPIRVDSPSISSLNEMVVDPQPVTSVEDEPIRVDSPSISSLDQMSVDPQPVADEPICVDSQSITSIDKDSSEDPQLVAIDQPMPADAQSVTSVEDKPICVDSQSISSLDMFVDPPQSIASVVNKKMTVDTQSVSSLDKPISLDSQSCASSDLMELHHISFDRRSISSTETTTSDCLSTLANSLPTTTSESKGSSTTSQSGTSLETPIVSTEGDTTSTGSQGDCAIEDNSAAFSSDGMSRESDKAYSINNMTSSSSAEQEKDKSGDNQRENTEFVQVNTENEKDSEYNEKDDESNTRAFMEHDPIGSDSFEPINNEDREGADAELCIIPDTEREISQAERDAASTIPPLRDLSEASAENSSDMLSGDQSGGSPIIIFKYEKEELQICNECKLKRKVKYYYTSNTTTKYLCDDNCLNILKTSQEDKVAFNWEEGSLRVKNFTGAIKEPPSLSFIRKCSSCKKVTNDIENNLTWEIMDFCNEFCLSKYQKEIGSHCSSCQGEVKSNSLGKYCVRFGNDIRQFCTSVCLEKYKKGLKVCSYCQQDMSGGPEGFLAPVGDKGQFKDFCSQLCMEKYDVMTNDRPPKVAPGTICSVCKAEKPITIEFELDGIPNFFCSEPCFVAFSFVNNISPGKCAMCRRHFTKTTLEKHTMYYDNVQHSFCSNSCENIYIIAHRKIVPCSWCKVKKYNFDMIRRYSKTGPMINMCSVNCLSLYRVSINAVNSRKTVCNFCLKLMHPMYHLTMSDATIRNFCSYNCVMGFQNQFPKQPITLNTLGESGFPVPTGAPKKNKKHPGATETGPANDAPPLPIISSVQSLASTNGNISPTGTPPSLTPINTRATRSKATSNAGSQILNSFADLPVQVQIKQHFIVRPAPMPDQRNVGTMCYTRKANKGTTMKPIMVDEEIQTEEREASKILIPVPVPIYVPTPMRMFNVHTPVPVPFPVPVPVPIFIPTTRNSAAGIMKEIKKIQVKIPTDPYEAELLMMAEMVAEEKKEEVTDSESDVDDTAGPEDSYSPEPVDASNTFGDDMLQMALKMATELDEPAVDLEGALTANTITAPQGAETHHAQEENVDDPQPMQHMLDRNPSVRGRKRGMRQARGGGAKRGRRMSHQQVDMLMMPHHQVQQPPPPPEPTEKPDANMCLKYTFGVNAWKQWVTTKNAELEKSSILSRPAMLFKTEILQLTSDELNYSLCLFVKEVRKPNGAEYAPDTIYYLCLGIQQYLFENGRIDNIFCDGYYEKFTDCLDEVAKKFSVLYNDSHYIVTRVEEEHLWESKQLGAHSPHVLLSTLMFFNTKHFNLTTVDEHMQLSFSHIMKHWKRNPNQPVASKVPGLRNVLLRFYPPQSAIQNNTRKKKVYEQEQNEENPLRCPVKLYEFYLSKCPESVKTRNDVFYLQPERSCVPDSPVWYSTMPLPREALEKMLHRVKMVKEINVALLTS